jgi:heme oxygenase (mycobilin-producing)
MPGAAHSSPTDRRSIQVADRARTSGSPAYVVASHLRIDPDGAADLERAFTDRLGEVEDADGFRHLEVWADAKDAGAYVMVSWWADEAAFRRYMGSDAHRRSHARIPRDPHAPRAESLHRYEVVAR